MHRNQGIANILETKAFNERTYGKQNEHLLNPLKTWSYFAWNQITHHQFKWVEEKKQRCNLASLLFYLFKELIFDSQDSVLTYAEHSPFPFTITKKNLQFTNLGLT